MRPKLIATLSILGTAVIQAATIHVPGDSPTIQGAIDGAAAGDAIIVHPGTYIENLDFLGKPIVVTGTAPRDSAIVARTVVDAMATEQDPVSVVAFASGEGPRSVLAGLTLTGGTGTEIDRYYGSPSTVGGGVFCDVGTAPRLMDLVVRENRTVGIGERVGGGGIGCESSSPSLRRCTVVDNSTELQGGGLYCSASSPTLVGCKIERNRAVDPYDAYGGGICCRVSSPALESCTINANSAGRTGGGIHCIYSSPTLDYCTIAANTALRDGAGLYCDVGSSSVLTNCTIAGNRADNDGGGLYNFASFLILENCILWYNLPEEITGTGGDADVTYSNVRGGWDGEGNISAGPRFCDLTCGEFNALGLAADSPCIGSGRGGADMGAWPVACDFPAEPTPTVLEVPAQYATLQAALDVACSLDTILVAPGSYLESELV